MYLYEILRGEKARRFCEVRLKMTVADYDLDMMNRVEVFGIGFFLDTGPDYCEFRVYDSKDKLMALRRGENY